QHVPRPRQHVVTYAGHYANAAGNLNLEPKKDDEKEASDDARFDFSPEHILSIFNPWPTPGLKMPTGLKIPTAPLNPLETLLLTRLLR
ncbi:MAG: hypothetical protein WC314_27395, partial [Vulcanimicrobiota bacterium]